MRNRYSFGSSSAQPFLGPCNAYSSAAIAVSRDEFAVWYQVELRLQAGRAK